MRRLFEARGIARFEPLRPPLAGRDDLVLFEHGEPEFRVVGPEVRGVFHLDVGLEAVEAGVAVGAQTRVAQDQRGRLVLLEMTFGAAFIAYQREVRRPYANRLLDLCKA